MKKAIVLLLIVLATGCKKKHDDIQVNDEPILVSYTESTEDFPNPERGFYHYSETSASSYSPLSTSVLKGYRTPKSTSGANYSVVSTLVFRYYVLDLFKESSLSADFLNKLIADCQTARAAGVKLIPRFTYTVDPTSGDCSEGFICPPYGDATKARVIEHINSLHPIFLEHADIIACVQLGFIGMWGENYYTDYFGDASSNAQGKLLDQNWQDRIDVLQAMLDALPPEIMVQVRYPQFKQRFVYGINAPVTSSALTEEEAFSGTDKARIGYHNDCFLASSDDYGTYEDYGNSSTPRKSANATLRDYFSADSRYGPVGGETCSDDYSPQNDCEPAGKAEKEMTDMHYSFLNLDYNNQVNNDWQTGGCMENIKKKLGYRFVLRTGGFPSKAKAGSTFSVNLVLENVGYTSPYKERPMRLILKSEVDGSVIFQDFDIDLRRVYPGTPATINQTFQTTDIIPGSYKLYLFLPDASPTIRFRPEYCIRLANDNVWDEETGYNDLGYTLRIE